MSDCLNIIFVIVNYPVKSAFFDPFAKKTTAAVILVSNNDRCVMYVELNIPINYRCSMFVMCMRISLNLIMPNYRYVDR